MSGVEVYNLRWSDYQSTFLSSMLSLLDSNDFVDVTIAVDGQSFGAHKVVLSACSAYFRKLLKGNPCQHPIVIIRHVRASTMELIIEFMYNGAVDVPEDHLQEFLECAQSLEVKGLADEDYTGKQGRQRPVFSDGPPAKRPRTTVPLPSKRETAISSIGSTGNLTPGQDQSDAIHNKENLHDGDENIKETKVEGTMTGSGKEGEEQALQIVEETEEEQVAIEVVNKGTVMSEYHDQSQSGQTHGTGIMEGLISGKYWIKKDNFPCMFCGKVFHRSTNLKIHIQRLHEVKPMEEWDQCEVCGKRFKTNNNLRNHLIVTHGMRLRR